jgi:hypothetical protein
MAHKIHCDNAGCPSSTVAPVVDLGPVEGYHTTAEGGVWRKKKRITEDGLLDHWHRRARLVRDDGDLDAPEKLYACTTACADAIDTANLGE